MEYRGHIEDGKVILEVAGALPNGTEVSVKRVETVRRRRGTGKTASKKKTPTKKPVTISKRLLRYAGCATDLPADASVNLDHYLYGHRKR